uniref:Immunoglobulin domain-containing protein n=1 Tax=Salarias fasciatus TaxID=181472 RepID=A0A672IFF9_SALFA
METLTLISALLSIFCWISSSVGDFRTVEVLPGEEATMLCSNFTNMVTPVVWYRLTNSESSISHISVMLSSDGNATLYAGFKNGRFTMTSNSSHIFLNIKPVDLSDFGLYFCGHYKNSGMDIFNHTYLKMQGENQTLPDSQNSTNMLLGGLIVFLIVVIVALVFKIRSSTVMYRWSDFSEHSSNFIYTGSGVYAAVTFQPRTNRGRRQTAEKELEPHVVYAATR